FLTQQGQYFRIDRDGKELKTFQLPTRVNYYSSIQLVPGNRILVTQLNGVAEYDESNGNRVWSATVARNPTSVMRLPNGNTLVSTTSRKIVEIDHNGKSVWDFTPADNDMPC